MVVKTLDAMQRGGIYDHVGYGFHRYSTDRKWLVPHFEKMLYDQALLAMAYAETFQVTGRKDFRKTAEDTVTYVLEDLATEDGLFSSARDADSEGEEGRFYLWTMNGIGAVLDEDDTALAREAFGLREEGNAPGMGKGMNIIHLAQGPDALARKLGLDVDTLTARLAHILAASGRPDRSGTTPEGHQSPDRLERPHDRRPGQVRYRAVQAGPYRCSETGRRLHPGQNDRRWKARTYLHGGRIQVRCRSR